MQISVYGGVDMANASAIKKSFGAKIFSQKGGFQREVKLKRVVKLEIIKMG